MKFLTQSDQLEEVQDPGAATLERQTDAKLKEIDQFYFPPSEKDAVVEEPPDPKQPATAQSTIRGEYYYQYAVNEGLGHLDKVDSSQLSLHTPAECDRVSIDGLREPPVLFTSPEIIYQQSNANLKQPAPFSRGPKRLSTRKNDNVFAWKLFQHHGT
jgi:hypothetical protein